MLLPGLKTRTLEKFAAFSFLAFLLLTPLIYKLQLRAGIHQEGIYLEPLLPFLVLSGGLFLRSFLPAQAGWRRGRNEFWGKVKEFLIPHPIAKVFYTLLSILLLSWIYGVVLTGNLAWGDLLRLIKYGLYFLVFPLSIRTGRVLGKRWIHAVLAALFLVGVAASIVSLYRIYQFAAAGNAIDFWAYSPASRSVGFLGQYLDLGTLKVGQIPKAAHATFGLYLSVILGMGLVFFAEFKNALPRFLTLTGIGVVYAALLYTLSRGAVATGGLVILAGLAWLIKNRKFWAFAVITVLLFLESSVLIQLNREVYEKFASTFPGSQQITSRFLEITAPVGKRIIGDGQDLANFLGLIEEAPQEIPSIAVVREKEIEAYPGLKVAVDQSLGERVVVWENTWTLLKSRPLFFVFGVGYSIDNLLRFTGGEVVYPHSLFLDMWARGGLSALAVVLVVWGLLFFKVAQFAFSRDGFLRASGFGLSGFLLGWFVDNAVSGEQFFSDAPMLAFWGVLGLVMALAQVESQKSKVKKVLIALTNSDVGGAPKVVYDLLLAISHKPLAGREFDFVVAAPAGGSFNRKFRKLGYKVYPVPLDRIGIRGFMQLFKISRKEKIDLINSHGKGAGLYARPVGAFLGVPVVQTFHGLHYEYGNQTARFLYLKLEKLLTVLTKLVINVSPSQQKQGLVLGLFPRAKSRVVRNGIDVRAVDLIKVKRGSFRRDLQLKPTDFVGTLSARFDPVKGHLRLVEMVPGILEKVPNLKLLLVGDGEMRKAVEERVKELGIVDAVRFLGWRPDVIRILKSSDSAILASYNEGMPLFALEAMACGLPVIGSNVVGIRDLVRDGETGYLVDLEHGYDPLADALAKLAKNSSLRQEMGERGRRLVKENFGMEKFVGNTLSVYQESLKN